MDLKISKANNGFIIKQGEHGDVSLIQTEGNPTKDKEATIDLLYVVAAWAGVITEEENDLFIAFDDEDGEDVEDGDVEEEIE